MSRSVESQIQAYEAAKRAATMPRTAKRGYSREFRPHGDTGKRYLLDKIPAGLWADVKHKAKREGISIRALILKLLTQWLRDQPAPAKE